jgi:hypothetical protein
MSLMHGQEMIWYKEDVINLLRGQGGKTSYTGVIRVMREATGSGETQKQKEG